MQRQQENSVSKDLPGGTVKKPFPKGQKFGGRPGRITFRLSHGCENRDRTAEVVVKRDRRHNHRNGAPVKRIFGASVQEKTKNASSTQHLSSRGVMRLYFTLHMHARSLGKRVNELLPVEGAWAGSFEE